MLSEVLYTIMPNKKVLLSIESDKTDEVELQRAVDRASALLSASCGGGGVHEPRYVSFPTIVDLLYSKAYGANI
jgi:hypothetical protein